MAKQQPTAALARLNAADEFDAKIVLLGDTGPRPM
jgi:hypothetical protein